MPAIIRLAAKEFERGTLFEIVQGDTPADVTRHFRLQPSRGLKNNSVAAYIGDMPVLGNNLDPHVWVLIGIRGRDHDSWLDDVLESGMPVGHITAEITAIVFARTEAEAVALLATHPVYLRDLRTGGEYEADETVELNPLSYIFGDEGVVLTNLAGSWTQVPDDRVSELRYLIAESHLNDRVHTSRVRRTAS